MLMIFLIFTETDIFMLPKSSLCVCCYSNVKNFILIIESIKIIHNDIYAFHFFQNYENIKCADFYKILKNSGVLVMSFSHFCHFCLSHFCDRKNTHTKTEKTIPKTEKYNPKVGLFFRS